MIGPVLVVGRAIFSLDKPFGCCMMSALGQPRRNKEPNAPRRITSCSKPKVARMNATTPFPSCNEVQKKIRCKR